MQVALSRREQADATLRASALAAELVSKGTLSGSLRVPNTVGDLTIVADIRTGRCTIEVDVPAPAEGRPATRVNWLVRQLPEAHDAVRIDAFAHMARNSTGELLKVVRVDPSILLPDPKVDLRRFRIAATSQLGTKRGIGRGAFIDSVLGAIEGFYKTVLQGISPWVAKAPQLAKPGATLAEAGIDTSVLPNEQLPADDNVGTGTARGAEPEAANDTNVTSGAEENSAPLVDWTEQQEDIEEERLASLDTVASPD